ncbi:hypothetical protein CP533_4796 [Ophiocordyceps camponoti-saundersi (nom. inval.)]|nr:hypothetical protein CP533_4796 [Ophiocordyceps camponoti-saundersi (nom. inval.)]
MPIRNPFNRKSSVAAVASDDGLRPNYLGFERVDTVGSKALSIRSARSQDTGEYKMSVVNDSGVYLPPSPPDERAPWPRRYLSSSRNSSDTRSSSDEFQHFSISRESFDSYRRSFDISARSPVASPPRQSLESPKLHCAPRSAPNRHFPPADDSFEDIGLEDDHSKQPRRRGFFSKFGEPAADAGAASPAVSRFLMPGRKRGHGGQDAELGIMHQPSAEETGR